jgi:putative oxidoreductase
MTTTSVGEPRPIIPTLAPFYAWTREIFYPIIRVTAGGMLLAHGVIKLMTTTVTAFAAGSMARRGIEPSLPAAYLIFFLETVGAICLILGLFTRFFAAAIAIELAVIIFHASWRNGFSFSNPGGGWEFPFLWGPCCLRDRFARWGALNKDAPFHREIERVGAITSRPVLGGLHHQYCRI